MQPTQKAARLIAALGSSAACQEPIVGKLNIQEITMSVPATDITCDSCDYSGSTGVCFGIFKYQTPFGNISIPRTLGWCSLCGSVSPIEDTDQVARFNSLKEDSWKIGRASCRERG